MLVHLPNPEAHDRSSSSDGARTLSRRVPRHLLASLLCVAIYSGAVAAVWPVVELATDDDFAYSRMAWTFAHTGRFVFNGWETAMIGWQVAWGALFVRLFGYSYLTLRFSVIVLGAALIFLLHRVLLRAGVTGPPAVLGAVTVGLSPLLLPMAVSYMTDVPALLCLLICLYGCQRALRARNDRTALAWLCGSAALNVADGTVRQIAWLGALVIVPSAFWLLRRRKGFLLAGIATWLLSTLSVALVMLWFLRQPYTLPEHILRGPITWITLWHILRISVYGPLEVLCFSLPVFVAWLPEVVTLSRKRKLQVLGLAAVATPLILWAAHYNKIQGRLPPWSANVVSRYGILWSVPLMGTRPEILSVTVTSFIAAMLLASLAGFLIWLPSWLRTSPLRAARPESPAPSSTTLSLYESVVLLLPFMAVYFVLLFPRAAFPSLFTDVFDRYYLPLIAAAVILLLRLLQERSAQLPIVCYLTLGAFSFFSITGTHDVFIAYRAIAATRTMMEKTGIPPTAISGPWQEDGAQQIAAWGYLNDNRLDNPPHAYQPQEHPPLEDCGYWFGPLVPALHFEYVLTVQKLKCLAPSQFPDVPTPHGCRPAGASSTSSAFASG